MLLVQCRAMSNDKPLLFETLRERIYAIGQLGGSALWRSCSVLSLLLNNKLPFQGVLSRSSLPSPETNSKTINGPIILVAVFLTD
jgi:hypothetical protein